MPRAIQRELREALDDTGSQLIEALGDNGWQQAERHAVAMPVHQALDRALTGLEALARDEDPVAGVADLPAAKERVL